MNPFVEIARRKRHVVEQALGRRALVRYLHNVLLNVKTPEGARFDAEVLSNYEPVEQVRLASDLENAAGAWVPTDAPYRRPDAEGSYRFDLADRGDPPQSGVGYVWDWKPAGNKSGFYTQIMFHDGRAASGRHDVEVWVEID